MSHSSPSALGHKVNRRQARQGELRSKREAPGGESPPTAIQCTCQYHVLQANTLHDIGMFKDHALLQI